LWEVLAAWGVGGRVGGRGGGGGRERELEREVEAAKKGLAVYGEEIGMLRRLARRMEEEGEGGREGRRGGGGVEA
jgi:hypothetical protein